MRSSSADTEFLGAGDGGDVAAQFLEAVIADGDAEVLAGDVFDFMGLIEDHGVIFGQNAAFGIAILRTSSPPGRRRTDDG